MKKQWLITLAGLILALVAITSGGFALAGDESDNDDHGLANDEWKLVEVSGWPSGFSLSLPQGWQLNELQGIDSYVGEIIGVGGRLTYDFGWYSNSLVDDDDPQYIVTYEEIGGRRAKLVRPRGEGDGLVTGVYIEEFDGSNLDIPSQNRLQISGVGLSSDQQEAALGVFRTIRPLASESQGDSESSGDHIVTSIDDIDPNVCNGIHDISACTHEELEELGNGDVQYELQSHDEVVTQDCGLAGGTVYITSDGEVGCIIVHDLEDGGAGETQEQPPTVLPQPDVLPSAR